MAGAAIHCKFCQEIIPSEQFNQPGVLACRSCGSKMIARVFPAFFHRRESASLGERVQVDGEASCFYHATKKAVVACEGCGRFLCSLCEISIGGERLCPACLESKSKKGEAAEIEQSRKLYDEYAVLAAFLGFILWWIPFFPVVAAGIVYTYTFRYWRTSLSLVPRSRWRFVFACVFVTIVLVPHVFHLAFLFGQLYE